MAISRSRVPAPRRWSPFGSLPELRRDPLGTLLSTRATYGDVVKFRAGLWSAYLLSHPDDVKHVLQDNNQNYRKGFSFDFLKPVLGMGLLTNEGESWLRQRRLAAPAFHRERLGQVAGLMTTSASRLLDRWRLEPSPRPLDVAHEMAALTMEIAGRALLGSAAGADAGEVSEAVKTAQEHVNRQITHLITVPDRFPTRRNREFRRALDTLNDVVYGVIDARRAAAEACAERADGPAGNLLTLLMEAQDEDSGERMTDLQLRDEVMTIFLTGYETTANALAWTWHLLALNPEVEERLHAEVDAILSGRPPSIADFPRLQYTRMVIEESLRLRPPVWAIGRFPVDDDVAGNYRIPAHATVIVSAYVTHRHPAFWEEPERFDPERFLPGKGGQRPRYAYFPFGGGPRMCIGSEFALMMAVISLAAIAAEFRFRPVSGHEVEPEALVTLRPRGGLPMILERR